MPSAAPEVGSRALIADGHRAGRGHPGVAPSAEPGEDDQALAEPRGLGEGRYPRHPDRPTRGFVIPPKEETYTTIEGLITHFKFFMKGHGIRPPKGEVYFSVEGGNGELGYYIVSDGTRPALPAPPPGALSSYRGRPGGADPGPLCRRRHPDVRVDEHDRRGAGPMSREFSAASTERSTRSPARYPKKEAALLPVLHLVQDGKGLHRPRLKSGRGPALLGLRPIKVREVVTFYTMFRRGPSGDIISRSAPT